MKVEKLIIPIYIYAVSEDQTLLIFSKNKTILVHSIANACMPIFSSQMA